MRWRTLLPGLCLMALLPLAHADEPRTISVSGSATLGAVPDIAHLTFAVQQRDADMRVARDATLRVSRDFLALCRRLGIAPEKVRSTGLDVRPEYRWDPAREMQVFTGYFVSRQLEVELGDIDRLGELVEGAMDAGVNQVSPPRLDHSQRRTLHRQALAEASLDARANAQRIVETLGMTLGPVRLIRTEPVAAPPSPGGALRMAAMASDGAAETHQPGEITFEARVEAVFDVRVE